MNGEVKFLCNDFFLYFFFGGGGGVGGGGGGLRSWRSG